MKSVILVISVIGLTQSSAQAQPELGIVLKGGPNAATLAEDNRNSRYGFSGGFATYIEWLFENNLSLSGQVELLYTQRGAEATFEGEFLSRFRQHYFDIIIAARPEIKLNSVNFYLLLGGGFDLLLSANREDASGMTTDIADFLKRYDVALLVGAGVAFHLPRKKLGPFRFDTAFLEVRHDHGLIDTDTVNGGGRNRATSFMIGLSFSLTSGSTARSLSPSARSDLSSLGASSDPVE